MNTLAQLNEALHRFRRLEEIHQYLSGGLSSQVLVRHCYVLRKSRCSHHGYSKHQHVYLKLDAEAKYISPSGVHMKFMSI